MLDMRRMKKYLVVLLTLIMLLSVSATAFAAEAVHATVDFYNGTTQLWTSQTVELSADTLDRSSYYDLTKYPDATNPCGGEPSVLDAIITAIDQINEEQTDEEMLTYHIDWVPQSTDSATHEVYPDGFYLDDIYVGDPNSGDNDFITVNTFIPGTPNVSKGSGWNGYNGTVAFTSYLSNVPVTDQMNIHFNYESYRYEW